MTDHQGGGMNGVDSKYKRLIAGGLTLAERVDCYMLGVAVAKDSPDYEKARRQAETTLARAREWWLKHDENDD